MKIACNSLTVAVLFSLSLSLPKEGRTHIHTKVVYLCEMICSTESISNVTVISLISRLFYYIQRFVYIYIHIHIYCIWLASDLLAVADWLAACIARAETTLAHMVRSPTWLLDACTLNLAQIGKICVVIKQSALSFNIDLSEHDKTIGFCVLKCGYTQRHQVYQLLPANYNYVSMIIDRFFRTPKTLSFNQFAMSDFPFWMK